MKLRIWSLNVRGLRKQRKRIELFNRLKNSKVHIALFQETYITDDIIELCKTEWEGKIYFDCFTSHSRGLIVCVNQVGGVGKIEMLNIPNSNSRLQIVKVILDDDSLMYIVNVYAPTNNNEKGLFFQMLKEKLKKYIDIQNAYVLIAGDMNCTLDRMDIIAGEAHSEKSVNNFRHFVNNCVLVDTWRVDHPDEKSFTWKKSNPFVARRLDYILVNEVLHSKCVSTDIIVYPRSDRDICEVEFTMDNFRNGPSYWKLNSEHLKDKNFVNEVSEKLDVTCKDYIGVLNDQELWDLCKVKIKQVAIAYSKKKAKEGLDKLYIFERKVNELHKHLAKYPDDQSSLENYNYYKYQCEMISNNKTKGAQVRSRIKWIEEGEKNTSFFLGMEKSNAKRKTISALKDKAGQTVTNQNEILNLLLGHFTNIFSKNQESENVDYFCEDIVLPTLTEKEQDSCEGMFTLKECTQVLKSMKLNTSPGIDGLGPEFYLKFWDKVGPLLVNSFNYSNKLMRLSPTQRKGIITLIPKNENQPKDLIKNYRQITLTCCDYKIGAAVLGARIQAVIKSIVNTDQTAYIKGRGIHQNLRLIEDVIWYCNENNKPGAILALDYARAFDSISKEYIQASLRKFNFGPEFLRWIEVFNTDNQSCIINSGWLSAWFRQDRGIRQGCPLSALLFVIATEVFACKLRQCVEINKINICGIDLCVSQYADDTTIFVQEKTSVLKVIEIADNFSKVSGLQ